MSQTRWFALAVLQNQDAKDWGITLATDEEFAISSSWHELKQKTLTDRRPGGKVAVEARHSGRGLRALCCLKTTGATVGQVSWEASVPVWCTLMALKHTHTRTDAPGSWGRNREYGRWRASQLELEHSAFALLLSLHNSWCHCSQPLLPTFSGALYFWPPVSLPLATSPCLLPWKLPPSCHHPPVASFCHLCPHPLLSPPSIPVTFQSPLLPCCFQPSSPVLSASPPLPIGLLAKPRLSLHLPSRSASSQLPPWPPVSLPVTWPTYLSSFSSFLLFYRQLIRSVCPDIPEEDTDMHTKTHTCQSVQPAVTCPQQKTLVQFDQLTLPDGLDVTRAVVIFIIGIDPRARRVVVLCSSTQV